MDKATVAAMGQREWETIDLWQWLIAHYRPYTKPAAEAYRQRFGYYDQAEVQNILFEIIYPALLSAHRSNLDAKGEKRNQVLFRTLLVFSQKRVPWTIRQIYPSNESRIYDAVPSFITKDKSLYETPEWDVFDKIVSLAGAEGQPAQLSYKEIWDERAQREYQEESRLSQVVEQIRALVPHRWYQVLRMSAVDRLEPNEIAARLGLSVNRIYSIRSKTKSRLIEILDKKHHIIASAS